MISANYGRPVRRFKMDVKALITEGKLTEARRYLVEAVKSSPADLSSRTLLFQILAYLGEWDKAQGQLEVIATQDAARELGVSAYQNLIQAEIERIDVFQSKRNPSFLPKSPDYLESYESGLRHLENSEFDKAEADFKQIDAQCGQISGTVNGKEFTGFKDTDTRLSYFLEAFVHERYVWLPLESLREMSLPSPKTLLDLLWTSAQITTWEGLTLNCYLPALYPQSFRHEDNRLKLGRLTDWIDLGGDFCQGVGQHVFSIGEAEMGLLEIREVKFNQPGSEASDETKD